MASCKPLDSLLAQLGDYLKEYPDRRMIVIDALQKIRTASRDDAYASNDGGHFSYQRLC
jgi:hypothetical protein